MSLTLAVAALSGLGAVSDVVAVASSCTVAWCAGRLADGGVGPVARRRMGAADGGGGHGGRSFLAGRAWRRVSRMSAVAAASRTLRRGPAVSAAPWGRVVP